jgi:hypothetical protein
MARIDCPRRFRETRLGLSLPLIVREDWGHGGRICRADTLREVRELKPERFSRPVAVEFIDVRSPRDGLYRKYRYIAAGEVGVSHSMHVCRDWRAMGTGAEYGNELRDEELHYTSNPDSNHEQLQRAREALGLDFVAFDYSYDPQGRLVVWEANPYPHLHFPRARRIYRLPAIENTLAAMVRLYLDRGGLPTPHEIEQLLASPGVVFNHSTGTTRKSAFAA